MYFDVAVVDYFDDAFVGALDCVFVGDVVDVLAEFVDDFGFVVASDSVLGVYDGADGVVVVVGGD